MTTAAEANRLLSLAKEWEQHAEELESGAEASTAATIQSAARRLEQLTQAQTYRMCARQLQSCVRWQPLANGYEWHVVGDAFYRVYRSGDRWDLFSQFGPDAEEVGSYGNSDHAREAAERDAKKLHLI